MRIPSKPPPFSALCDNAQSIQHYLEKVGDVTYRGRYVHWDRLKYKPLPDGVTLDELWTGLQIRRRGSQKEIPLLDSNGIVFRLVCPDEVQEMLLNIDRNASGRIEMPDQIVNPQTRDRYIISSLMEEAVRSSQLEGAATTMIAAKEMIRSGRNPENKSERMVLNNFLTMRKILEFKNDELSPELVLEIQRMVMRGTLDYPNAAGRLRHQDENVRVADADGKILHTPPPALELRKRVRCMCDFANGKTPKGFLHPVLRSVILHFWLAYDHPFYDGNGRTARALFYWSMLKEGYWLCEFLSISSILRNAPSQYARAFLYTESDDNDLTYFVIYHLGVIKRAIDELHEYIERKSMELQRIEKQSKELRYLNHRQKAAVLHALRHPHAVYTIASHRLSHGVAYETARRDLMDLCKRGLLVSEKIGKAEHFSPTGDMPRKLSTG